MTGAKTSEDDVHQHKEVKHTRQLFGKSLRDGTWRSVDADDHHK